MNISVIVCAYNDARWQTLVETLDSLRQQSVSAHEILLVIDNNAALAERARIRFPFAQVLLHDGAPGLSHARNLGVTQATGEILAFIDDDAVADPRWLEQMLAGYCEQDVLGVGGEALPEWSHQTPEWFPEEFNWVVGCSYRGLPRTSSPVRNFIGCNMSFRRSVFEEVSGFHSELGRVAAHPVGCEETELCIRIQQRWPEGQLLYQPEARVRHMISANRKGLRYFVSRCYFEGRSKARVSRLVGKRDGLSSERSYTLKTLPMGMLRGVRESLTLQNLHGIARSGAILTGLFCTMAGYLVGTTKRETLSLVPQSPIEFMPKHRESITTQLAA